MEEKCYCCEGKDFQIQTITSYTGNGVIVFTQSAAEMKVCRQCGAIITMMGEHPHHKDVKGKQ